MKITICQIDSKPLKIKENSKKVLEETKKAKKNNSNLVIFPELSLTGYSCMDKFLDENFIQKNLKELENLAQKIQKIDQNISVLVGFVDVDKNSISENGLPTRYNAVALIQNGEIQKIFHKTLLPEYDIFNEKRYFKSGNTKNTFILKNLKIGVQICEDLWDENYTQKPTKKLVEEGAELIINVSGSPFEINKFSERKRLILEKINQFKIPFIYVNKVGSQDGYDGQLIFDGRSLVFNKKGEQLAVGKAFEEGVLEIFVPLEYPTEKQDIECSQLSNELQQSNEDFSENNDIIKAITLGIKTYFKENNFNKIFIGISGGVDSALVATLSVLAIGKKHVEGVVMPSKFTSQKSLELADDLIKNLGIQKKILPINDSLEIVKNTFEKNNLKLESLANENAQARLRGLFLMSLANSENGLVLTTSNKTEMALGYSTLYGDMCGGLAPISDLSKQKVFELCYHINKTNKQTLIPEKIITRKPTAELRNNQTDEESLGLDYKTLSPLVDELIEKSNLINLQNLEKKYGKENVAKIQNLIQKSEFKRRQSPPGIKLTSKSFGLGRREPF